MSSFPTTLLRAKASLSPANGKPSGIKKAFRPCPDLHSSLYQISFRKLFSEMPLKFSAKRADNPLSSPRPVQEGTPLRCREVAPVCHPFPLCTTIEGTPERQFPMPRVLLNPNLVDLRGSMDQQTFSRNRSGNILKKKAKITPSNTPKQQKARSNFGKASTLYKALSGPQIASWETYAQAHPVTDPLSGEKYIPAAINVFNGLGSKFLQITPGGTVPSFPPAVAFTGDTLTITPSAGDNAVVFVASAANLAGVKTELMLQLLPSRTRKPAKDKYDSYGFFNFAAANHTAEIDVVPGFYAPAYRYVNPATGQELGIVPLSVVEVLAT